MKGSSFYAFDWEGWARNVKRSFSKPILKTQKDFENVWWFACFASSAVLFLDNSQDLVNQETFGFLRESPIEKNE